MRPMSKLIWFKVSCNSFSQVFFFNICINNFHFLTNVSSFDSNFSILHLRTFVKFWEGQKNMTVSPGYDAHTIFVTWLDGGPWWWRRRVFCWRLCKIRILSLFSKDYNSLTQHEHLSFNFNFSILHLKTFIKFICSEKATKIWRYLQTFFDATT